MKKFCKALEFIGSIIISPVYFALIIIYWFLSSLFYPIELLIYKKSKFYKEYNKKFSLGMTRNFDYRYRSFLLKKGIKLQQLDKGATFIAYYNDDTFFLSLHRSSFDDIKLTKDNELLFKPHECLDYLNAEQLKKYFKEIFKNEIGNRNFIIIVKRHSYLRKKEYEELLKKYDIYCYKRQGKKLSEFILPSEQQTSK